MSESDFSKSKLNGPSSVSTRKIKVQNHNFTIDKRYKILEIIGKGGYGVVVSVLDKLTGDIIAIKKIKKVFNNVTYAKRTLRELRIMRLMNHDNILGLKSIQLPLDRENFHHIYMVLELLDTDLATVIKSDI